MKVSACFSFLLNLYFGASVSLAQPAVTPLNLLHLENRISTEVSSSNTQECPGATSSQAALPLAGWALSAPSVRLTEDISSSPSEVAALPAVDSIIAYRPLPQSRTMDKKFILLNGFHLAMAMLDVTLTQRCLANGRCREGNPLMPSSLMGQLGMNFGFVAYGSIISYRLKRHRVRLWWTSPSAGVASHSVGIAFDAAHQ